MTGKDVLLENDLLEKAAASKRFEYSPLGKELKKQTSVAEKWYQKFNSAFESNKNEEDKTKKVEARSSNLVYHNYFIFYKYHKINECVKHSLDSKLNDLKEFKKKLELFYHDTAEIKPNNKEQIRHLKKKRKVVLTKAHELYDKFLNIYKTQYDKLTKGYKKSIKV